MYTEVLEIKKTTGPQVTSPRQQPSAQDSVPPEAALSQMITGSLASQAVYGRH